MPTALITGASSGIGLEFARICAAEGYDLLLVARSGDRLERIALELGSTYRVQVRPLAADLCDMEMVRAVVAWTDGLGKDVDLLVNDAGFGAYGETLDTDWDAESRMIDLNAKALTYLSKQYATRMKRRGGGRICNLASVAAFQPGPLMAVYYATKAYVLSFSTALAEELRDTGVTVTALCPGVTRTGFAATARSERARIFRERSQADPADVARYGYEATMRGETVAVHGARNKLTVWSLRFMPEFLVRRMSRHNHEPVPA